VLSLPGRDRPVLALDVDAHQGPGPLEGIRDHAAGALPRARGSRERDALLAGELEIPPSEPSQEDPVLAEESGRADLAAIREARLAVQAPPPREEREARRGEHPDEGHRARPQDPPAYRGPIGVIVAVAHHGERR